MQTRPLVTACVLLLAAATLEACDDNGTPAVDVGPGQEAAVPDSGIPDGIPADVLPADGGGDGSAPDLPQVDGGACAGEIAALATELHNVPQACTIVVRLDHNTLALLGYELICGQPTAVTEAQARTTAQNDTGYGASGQALNPANPKDAFVFYMAPGDFGGAAAVSARTGLSVFGGSIIWMGVGQLTYPKTWRAVSTLGSGCPPGQGIPGAVSYDLVQPSQPLPAADVNKVLAVVSQTAIPAAMWSNGVLHDAVVLRYPRSVGAFDPSTAEWIVLINGGSN